MELSRQEYRSGLPFPPPGDLPTPVIEPGSPALQADSLPATTQKVHFISKHFSNPPDYSMSETQPHFVDMLLSEDQLCFASHTGASIFWRQRLF